jgi:hypothetical protein
MAWCFVSTPHITITFQEQRTRRKTQQARETEPSRPEAASRAVNGTEAIVSKFMLMYIASTE